MGKEMFRPAVETDIVKGNFIWIDGDDYMEKFSIEEVLRPNDPFKAYVADGCRYGLDRSYIKLMRFTKIGRAHV